MVCEVLVVGGGIGGLTVAALLATRGVNVCLLERNSRVGGCVEIFEKFGYRFDPGLGLYTEWEPGGIHNQVFSELPVEAPEVQLRDPAYCVRLPDQTEVSITSNTEQFETTLAEIFPECADEAIRFYRDAAHTSDIIRRSLNAASDLHTTGMLKRVYTLLPRFGEAARIVKSRKEIALQHLESTSLRFRRFVEVQLQLLAQVPSHECSYHDASLALNAPRQGMFSIRGGATALAERLAESIKASGGRIRLDTPVLRLAYDAAGQAVGVDLLSGETLEASQAIISNLTVWDTYGKLMGLNRAPLEVRKTINGLRGWGVYLLYVGVDEATATRIPHDHVLALTDWQENQNYDPEVAQFMSAAAPSWDPRAPAGRRAVTIQVFTDVEQWFTFHENEEQHEEKDRSLLEAWWPRIQRAIPELGDDLELIETVTPRTMYDQTRRKLGMVGAPSPRDGAALGSFTSLPNVFMVSDTTSQSASIACVTRAALALANHLTR
ncbi:MAG: phytoene desaturase family protein [Pyrinomonadaceae bacterium]